MNINNGPYGMLTSLITITFLAAGVCTFIHSFVRSFIPSLIYSFVRSFNHISRVLYEVFSVLIT